MRLAGLALSMVGMVVVVYALNLSDSWNLGNLWSWVEQGGGWLISGVGLLSAGAWLALGKTSG